MRTEGLRYYPESSGDLRWCAYAAYWRHSCHRPEDAGQDAPADITSATPEPPVNPDIIPVDPDTPVNPVDPDTPADTEQQDGPIAGPAAPADQDTIPEEPRTDTGPDRPRTPAPEDTGPEDTGQPEPAPQNYRQLTLLPPVN